MDYYHKAYIDAQDMIKNFEEEIARMLIDEGEASDDFFNDYTYGDAYHHENHVDGSYSLTEAAEVLKELGEYEEADNGWWEGVSPIDAISIKAAYTYGNAVIAIAQGIIANINADFYLEGLVMEYIERNLQG